MYICEDCGIVVEELETLRQSHPYGEGWATEEYFNTTCPHCRGELVEAKICPVCETVYINSETEEICSNCIEDAMTFENAKEMGEESKSTIEVNGFWGFVFTEEEINEILEREFKGMLDYTQKEYVKEYCLEDKWYFSNYIKEKKEKC
jgi:hypothetical protein